MSLSCKGSVLSGRGLCDSTISRPDDPTECGVSEYDLET